MTKQSSRSASIKRSLYAPGFLMLTLLVVLLVIVFSPEASKTVPTTSPLHTPVPVVPTPRPTLEPIRPTGVIERGVDSEASTCQPGIVVDRTVQVLEDEVRMRRSIGYLNKPTGDILHALMRGDTARVKGGPARQDELCWWLVAHEGFEGWSADHSPDGTPLLAPAP